MINAATLPGDTARDIVGEIQRVLWHDGEQWDGDRVWSPETIEDVAGILERYGLRPPDRAR